ncbi:hypothetical protein N7470_006537 [Penicillium chermesinum]|nr:hypothetical protein N7470_006537 [Penicillium chermesinum]
MVISYRGYRDDPRLKTRSSPEPASNGTWISLNIAVVGAGICGLVAAVALARQNHTITIYEQSDELSEVETGIQIPPNSARLLLKLGLGPYLQNYVTEPQQMSMRRWKSGNVIGYTRMGTELRKQFEAPYWVVHRGDYHKALHDLAVDLGVTIKLGSKVVSYDSAAPSISLEDGQIISADLVIAADGVLSKARKIVLGDADRPPHLTGFAAYHAVVDMDRMREDPEISWLLEKPSLNLWVGDNRHVMSYPLSSDKTFNMVLSHPDNSDGTECGDNSEKHLPDMQEEFAGWDPVLMKIIGLIDSTIKRPLYSGSLTSRLVRGKLIILGDAAHSMLPYMSQGTAMDVEDSVALAQSLSRITAKSQIPLALSIFETVRVERAVQVQEASLLNGKIWHFPDGPVQKARDLAMMPEVKGQSFSHSPNQWSDPTTQMWSYG